MCFGIQSHVLFEVLSQQLPDFGLDFKWAVLH